jgi:hypothetical protein
MNKEEKRSHPYGVGSMPSYGSTIICQAGWMDGSDLMDEGTGWYAGMCEEMCPESIVVWVLFEQGGNCAIPEIVIECMN